MSIRPHYLAFLLVLTCAPSVRAGDPADEAYAYIAGLAEKGLDEMVVKAARDFIAENPRHARSLHARYRLGSSLLALGDAGAAAEALAGPAAAREFEFVAEANLRLGRCHLVLKDGRRAQACAERARTLGREYIAPLARALAAEAAQQLGDWPAAKSEYAAWLAVEKEPARMVDARIGLAWVLLRSGDPRGAEKIVFDLAEADQITSAREAELLVLVGECALDDKRANDALARFREVQAGEWFDAAARGSGFALAALSQHAAAADAFERVVKDHPKSRFAAECALHAGIERLAAGDPSAARIALSSSNLAATSESSFWRARAELESGDPRAALATIDAALHASPDEAWSVRLQTARGAALEKLGRAAEAADAFARSGSVDGLQAAAAAELAAQRFEAAARTARRVLELNPPAEKAARARLTVGEAEWGAKQFARAEGAFLEAARLEPDPVRAGRARLRAAWCRFEHGDAAGAEELFNAALRAQLPSDEAAEAHFMRARCLELAGNRDGAARAFREHTERFASGSRALEAAVRAVRNANDEGALGELERAVDSQAEGAWADEARFELAERASAAARFDVAVRRYAEVIAATKDAALAARARYGLAWCTFSLGQFDAAADTLAKLLQNRELEPAVRSAALELAVFAHVKQANLAGALSAWKSFAADASAQQKLVTVAREVVNLARAQQRTGETARVLDELERNAKGTNGGPLSALRARVQVDAGLLDDAEAALRPLASREPSDAVSRAVVADAAFALAEAWVEKGALDRASEWYAVAARDPELADRALYKAGFVALKRGDAQQAEKDLARLVETHPQSPLVVEAQFLRAEALQRLDRFDEALPILERIRRTAPRHAVAPKALFRLGQCYTRRERWQEALDAFDALLRATPDFQNRAEIDLDRGRARLGLGDVRAARAAFDRAISAGAGVSADRARLEIGRLLEKSGDHEGALEQFLKVALLSGDAECVPEALFSAGLALEALGQAARAADRYREIVANHAQSAFASRAREKLERLDAKSPPTKKRRA